MRDLEGRQNISSEIPGCDHEDGQGNSELRDIFREKVIEFFVYKFGA
jgi:hypothetical protein